jgi:hypothetical protein
MRAYFIPMLLSVLLAGCADIESERASNSEDIAVSVEGGVAWSLGLVPMSLQIQEATLLCKEQGGTLQIVDTRIAAPSSLNSLEIGDVQFMCFGTIR